MTEIFVSYTNSDREWAFWVGQELESFGHTPHLHDWEVPGGGDIMAWMEARHDRAERVLCIVSKAYLAKPYSSLERRAAQWAATADRPNFLLPVFVEACKAPTLFAPLKRCDLYGVSEEDARARLKTFLEPAVKPSNSASFPGGAKTLSKKTSLRPAPRFPGKTALSNIPIGVPRHFLGRDGALAEIEIALQRDAGRVAITTLHGMRGVGKTTLAAAYAEQHRGHYRVTWWIRAQEASTINADLVALGVRLGWVGPNDKEKAALATVIERLRYEGRRILLIFDNAADAEFLKPFLPHGGRSQILVTSNSSAWRGVAAPVEIRVWPEDIGADYLIARTGREQERAAAKALSQALGGLPLAHEQAAAYCERLAISFESYRERFEAAPTRLLDKNAPVEYHDGLTAAKTFALAIEEAGKLHPAAEQLIVYAALLAPEPIPLFLFTEARKKFGEPLASAFADGGLDEAVGALCSFALVDRGTVVDERDAAIATDTIRLHRLIRHVAAARAGDLREFQLAVLIDVLAAIYPENVTTESKSWPRARLLEGLSLALTNDYPKKNAEIRSSRRPGRLTRFNYFRLWATTELPGATDALARWLRSHKKRSLKKYWYALRLLLTFTTSEQRASVLLVNLADYKARVLDDYPQAQALCERALDIRERWWGTEHRVTAVALHCLGGILEQRDNLAGARHCFEQAVAIFDKALGPDNVETATNLNGLSNIIRRQGDLSGARSLAERALRILEKIKGVEHHSVGASLNNLAIILYEQGDLGGARALQERALAISDKVLGPDNVETATNLGNLAVLLEEQGDITGARLLAERGLAIRERAFGPEHSATANSLTLLSRLLRAQGDFAEARRLAARAQAIREKKPEAAGQSPSAPP